MSSVYPGALDTLATNKANATAQATDHPAHHNDLADAVNKVEAELGVDPAGAAATVGARILAVESGDLPEFAAKGNLLAASGDNAGAALAVGTNGQVLTADSAQTLGVKWAAADVTQAELDAVAAAAVALAPATSARNVIQPTGAAVIPLVVKGAASQSASLQEWQNSAGTKQAALHADAGFYVKNDIWHGSTPDGKFRVYYTADGPSYAKAATTHNWRTNNVDTDRMVLTTTGQLQVPLGILVGIAEIDGALDHDGTTVGFYGVTPVARAAAIATPTSDTVGTKAAIDAIRVALTNLGLTS